MGRPPKGEEEDPEAAVRERRGRKELGPDWRPCYEAKDFINRGAGWLGVDVEDLQSRRRTHDLVRARELLMALGVERYGLKVKDLAREFRKSPDGMTQTIARAARRRTTDDGFRADLNELDHALAGAER